MSFPFGPDVIGLKQRILLAIGSGGLLLATPACGSSREEFNKDPGNAGQGSVAGSSTTGGNAGAMTPTGGQAARGGSGKGGSAPLTCPLAGVKPVEQCFARGEMERQARFGCGQIQKMPEPTAQEVAAAFLPNGCLPMAMACDGCCNPPASEGTPMGDGSCCYQFCPGACCGRPFEVGGELRLAGVRERRDWLDLARAGHAGSTHVPLARRIANEWLEDARMEHASIASFARFTLDLLATGAPAHLLEQGQRAALDEVTHARMCFALASRYAGRELGPASLPIAGCAPAANLSDAVLSAFREGCIGETLAATQARAAHAIAGDADVRVVLERIAEDETRHAELAWSFVAWGLPRCDDNVRVELRAALERALAEHPAPGLEHEHADVVAALHAAGRLTAAERVDLGRRALREVVVACTDTLLARPASAAATAQPAPASEPCITRV